jgi:hypothetical protein
MTFMSSPNTGTRKTAKAGAAKSASKPSAKSSAKASAKPAKKPASKPRTRSVDSEGLTGEDRASFVKAMWEGVSRESGKVTARGPAKKPEAEAPKVEILRRIPAPTVVPSKQTPDSNEALKLAATLEAKLADGDTEVLTPEATQALMAVIIKLYSANVEAGNRYPILSGRTAVTGTDAMIACGALLKAVDLQVFELGMWQSWSGI